MIEVYRCREKTRIPIAEGHLSNILDPSADGPVYRSRSLCPALPKPDIFTASKPKTV
jgi:hypothetical protein